MGNPWTERIASKAMPRRQPAQRARPRSCQQLRPNEFILYQSDEELGRPELDPLPEGDEADLPEPQDMDDAVDDPYHLEMFQGWDESWSSDWNSAPSEEESQTGAGGDTALPGPFRS
eukprot:5682396-Amphidinium_carterae.1